VTWIGIAARRRFNPRMLSLADPRWQQLEGGYRVRYDPRPALARLEKGADVSQAWSELWQELHHQGDVGPASYAAVPHLLRVHRARDVADWNTYALVGIIELQRGKGRNPPVPDWLKDGYEQAWRDIPLIALRDLARSQDPNLTHAALAIIALGRGLRRVGQVLLDFTEDELEEMVAAYLDEA
jgi:hypothetical protein